MPKSDLILLALDESPILNLMERALHVKYQTAIAKDSKTLGNLLQETTPALLLVGEKFNGHEGLKVAEELLERFPTLPILVYAEKPAPEFIKRIFHLGMSGYLAPPLKTNDVVDAVESGLRNAHRVGDWLRKAGNRT